MASSTPTFKFTYEDYRNTPDDKRYELLDGDLVVVPAPREVHQRVLMNLSYLLFQAVKLTGAGHTYAAPFDVVLSDTDVVQPDLLFVSSERSHVITDEKSRARQICYRDSFSLSQIRPNSNARLSPSMASRSLLVDRCQDSDGPVVERTPLRGYGVCREGWKFSAHLHCRSFEISRTRFSRIRLGLGIPTSARCRESLYSGQLSFLLPALKPIFIADRG